MNQEQRNTIERIRDAAERKIWVTFRKEGIHKYPAAASDPALATGDESDVSFLGGSSSSFFPFPVVALMFFTMIETLNSSNSNAGSKTSTPAEPLNSILSLAK